MTAPEEKNRGKGGRTGDHEHEAMLTSGETGDLAVISYTIWCSLRIQFRKRNDVGEEVKEVKRIPPYQSFHEAYLSIDQHI
eukprot:gene11071-7702_t